MIFLHDAVYSAYSNAGVVNGDDVNSLIVLDKEHKPMTIDPAVVIAKLAELQAAETAAEQAQATAKASALAKLTALGLTQDEVKALIG
jgi:hypothetical protein